MKKDTKNNFEKLSIDDLQEQHKPYAEIIGIENLIAMSKEFGGTPFYIPTTKELLKNTSYSAMMEEFDGTNIKRLAVKYGVSVSTAYKVLGNKIKVHRANPFKEDQITLF